MQSHGTLFWQESTLIVPTLKSAWTGGSHRKRYVPKDIVNGSLTITISLRSQQFIVTFDIDSVLQSVPHFDISYTLRFSMDSLPDFNLADHTVSLILISGHLLLIIKYHMFPFCSRTMQKRLRTLGKDCNNYWHKLNTC